MQNVKKGGMAAALLTAAANAMAAVPAYVTSSIDSATTTVTDTAAAFGPYVLGAAAAFLVIKLGRRLIKAV